MLVCHCYGVTDAQIRRIVEAGAADVLEVGTATGAGSGCGGCVPAIAQLLAGAGAGSDCVDCPMIGAARPPQPWTIEHGMERLRPSA